MKYILFWESLACSLRQAFSVKMYDIKISEDFFNFSDYNYREDGGKLHFGGFFLNETLFMTVYTMRMIILYAVDIHNIFSKTCLWFKCK